MPDHRTRLVIILLFLASGAVALIYQVVWARMMTQAFGSTALAVGTVLAAWMSGMAIGAWRIGRRADPHPNPLRLYAWLEIGIALTALGAHFLIHHLGTAHRLIYDWTGSSTFMFGGTRFLLALFIIMPPTILMGATLPVMVRFLTRRQTPIGINISTLYGVNTFGAVGGVLLTGFFLIGRYGIHVPVYLAVIGNLLVGLAALAISSRLPDAAGAPAADRAEVAGHSRAPDPQPHTVTYRVILFGLGLSGFTSFAYEIYWTRSLVFILGNSTYALTTMLAAFLSGIALGGYGARFLLKPGWDRSTVFGWVQVLLGMFSAFALPLLFNVSDPQSLNEYFLRNSDEALALTLSSFGVAFLVMLVPALLIGTTFPLVGQIAARDPKQSGATVGKVYAVNTLGNVLGALLPGLFLLNWLGIQKGIVAMSVLNISLGLLVLSLRLLRPPSSTAWRWALPALTAASLMTLGLVPVQFQFPSDGEQPFFQTLFYREGPLATTKVYANPGNGEKHISVDGIVIGGTGQSEYKQLLLAHLPKLLLDDVSSELSVGVGSGILLGESMRHAGVHSVTGVEIEPGVVEGAGWFAAENHRALEDPRLHIIVDDIGSFLRTRADTFKVISADEKTADEYASNGFSYSRDYYELLLGHLEENGLAAQWVPTTLPPRLYRMVLKTFAESFPYVQLWYFLPAHKRGPFNTILIGSRQEIPLRLESMRKRFNARQDAMESLVPYGLTSAEAVLPHYVAGRDALLDRLQEAPVNSLEFPRYEFFHPWDYAIRRQTQFIANHEFIIELKRADFAAFMASLEANARDASRMRQTLGAEFRYLSGFEKFLKGIPLAEQYRIFDDALAVAPWNDSLRARIHLQYVYNASTRRLPRERSRLMQKAADLYIDRP
ncbi:MAG: fused MFS/spermidine synthase [Xanthomonadales bacterium]|jgi:spermidine synthase|nr:fused MFS/spermidine synthase [Xanthomonadales bacterium]